MGYIIWPDTSDGEVLRAIHEERARQDAKWGQQDHHPERYFAILGEEFGEVAKEVVEYTFAEVRGNVADAKERLHLMREELIQTAAVAVAMVECIDRGPDIDNTR